MADEKTTSKQDDTAPAVPRRHPSRIPKLFESKGVQSVRQAHIDHYGFDPGDRFVADLAAFVEKPGKLPRMLSGTAEAAQADIRSIYGVAVSRDYAVDLTAYARQVAQDE